MSRPKLSSIVLTCGLILPVLLLWLLYRDHFPRVNDWSTLRMTLERTACLGSCPEYSIEVHGDGTVLYNGLYDVAITGQHRGTISQQNVADMLGAFRRTHYFFLWDSYRAPVTDLPTYITSIEIDGRSKKVVDYGGSWLVGMPAGVGNLEDTIDRLSDSERWTKGDAATIRALTEEGWDFHSPSAADALARIAWYGSPVAVHDLIAAGVPLSGHGELGGLSASALEAAAYRGNLDMLHEILAVWSHSDAPGLTAGLTGASHSGKIDAVRLLLQYGANPNSRRSSGDPPIVAAARSGVPAVVQEILKYRPDLSVRGQGGDTALSAGPQRYPNEGASVNRFEVLRLLLDAGADVDARNDNGSTALFENAWDPKISILLLQHRADPNATNKNGWTPLFNASSPDVARALLQYGADINIRDAKGKTALEEAQRFGNSAVASILQAEVSKPKPALP